MNPIVSHDEWQRSIATFREKEKAFTRDRDALNAERRKLPMTEVTKDYRFTGPHGEVSLLHLFEARKQLIVYHFMFDKAPCSGCSMMVDNMGHTAHVNARDTTRVLVSIAPFETLAAFQRRMGWDMHPWYSSRGSDFNRDFGATTDDGEMFGLSTFIRDGERIFQTYHTTLRGAEYLGSSFSYLDTTPMGRQELWEESPDWVPQTPPYQWWKLHDEY